MRIFMLVQRPTIRGPLPKLTSHLLAALRALGCTVATHPWGREREDESALEKAFQRFRDVLSLRSALRGEHYDVAVVQTSHDWRTLLRDIAAVLVLRRHSRHVVLQLHGGQPSKLSGGGHYAFKLATAVLLRLVDGVMVLSTEEQRQWQAFRRRPPVFAVKNPYVGAHASESAAPLTGSATAIPRVLFVGRLLEEKGICDLVEALPHVLEHEGCELIVVGDGEKEDELRERIRSLGLEDRVRMAGYLSGPDLSREYHAATVFVLPSWSEGFPTVLAEAMDAGLAVVTTRIRGAADHLVEGENALFVEPRDRKALASAIVNVLQNPELRARMAAANRERIRMFDPDVVGREYLEVLRTVVPG